jgi:hypothetical protein
MNKIKIAKQKRLARFFSWRFRAIELLTGGVSKEWDELTQDEKIAWFDAWIRGRMEQQND